MRIVICGLSITSSWGNGHATNYRALMRSLGERGHDVLFLERDVPWYASERDMPDPVGGSTRLYGSVEELAEEHGEAVAAADLVVVGSYVPDGVRVGNWVCDRAGGATAFYDIDTPVTLAKLAEGDEEYLDPELLRRFDLYLSFTSGPTLELLERRWGARHAAGFHCLVDPDAYSPVEVERRWDLGYLGTYSHDRQPQVQRLLVEPARLEKRRRFCVAGPGYPAEVEWPANVERLEHLPPGEHAAFYRSQRLTLNVTRAAMRRAGFSPSVRLFEAAACGVPIISDRWPGIETFLDPGREILLADEAADVVAALRREDEELIAIGAAARERVLAEHTADRRAEQLEELVATVGQRGGVA
jgi:spore maturation protein CgeB